MIGSRTILALGMGIAAATAGAQDYPAKPVRLIVPFPPGGSVDTVARLIAPRLTEKAGQPFVVENRSGASGNIGTEQVARAAPDGYMLAVHTIPFVANRYLYAKMPYDALTDFVGVSLLCASPSLLVVNPNLPARSVRELLDLARARPGKLNFATAGPATNPHIGGELINYLGKTDIVAIHYKGGGPAIMATVAGDTELTVSGIAETGPLATAGKLRALGVTSLTRNAAYPQIPTIAESGLPGYEFVTWHALLGPKGLAPAVATLLAERLKGALAQPDAARLLAANGLDVITSAPAELAAHLAAESRKWGRVIKERGMKAEP